MSGAVHGFILVALFVAALVDSIAGLIAWILRHWH